MGWKEKEVKKCGDGNKDHDQSNFLSELDKVSLNILYRPAITDEYKPKLGKTGLYYGGRKVTEYHNYPDEKMTDGRCGPDDGPNCPAGRTFRTKKMDELNMKGKFQGYSGMVYGGKKIEERGEGHDGICGPNNRPPCDECLKEILVEGEEVEHEYRLKEIEAEFEKITF